MLGGDGLALDFVGTDTDRSLLKRRLGAQVFQRREEHHNIPEVRHGVEDGLSRAEEAARHQRQRGIFRATDGHVSAQCRPAANPITDIHKADSVAGLCMQEVALEAVLMVNFRNRHR